MLRRTIELGFGAIVTYLVLYNASGAGTLLDKGGTAGVGLVKAFQGR